MDPLVKRARRLLDDLQRVPATQCHQAAQHRHVLKFALDPGLASRGELHREVRKVERWLRGVYRRSGGLCSIW